MIARKRGWYVLCISTIMLTWLCASPAHSQSSPNYTLEWSVMDEGGGVRSSANHTLWHSIGQASGIATSSSAQYTNSAGYYGKNVRESIIATKAQDVDIVQPGETFQYTLTAANFFDTAVFFMIQDALDAYVDYVAGTLYVNSVKESDDWFSGGILDYESGLVASGKTLTLSFDVMVSDLAPQNWIITNSALVTAYSSLDPSGFLVSVETNTVQVEVVPEPASLIFVVIGLFGIFALARQRRNTRK